MTQHCPLAVSAVSLVVIAVPCFLSTSSYLKQSFHSACLAPTWPPLTPPLTIQCCWESFPSAVWQVISILAISTNVRVSSLEDELFFLTYPALPSLTSASFIWYQWCVLVLAPTQAEVMALHGAALPSRSVAHQQSCCFWQVDVLPASSPPGWGNQPRTPAAAANRAGKCHRG